MAHPKTTIEQDRPDLIEWLVNEEDKYLGTESKKTIKIKCPACGAEEDISVNNFTKRIHTCHNCNKDGISYPNKILREFFKQIKEQVEFTQTEWNPRWAGNYKYDGHFIKNGIHYIIEMHGPQHYEKTSIWDFEAQKIRDAEKTELANINKFEQIIIDCRKSNFEYIKNNILASKLSEILDLNLIFWNKIAEKATKDYTKIVSDFYNQGIEITEIAQILMIDRHVVSRLLKEATIIGWCNYEAIPCTELYKINVKITNISTEKSVIIHGVKEACNFIQNDSGYKIDRHTIKNYVEGYYYSYYNKDAPKKISLEGKLYKRIYKFEYLNDKDTNIITV